MKRKIWCLTMFKNYFDAYTDLGVIGASFRGERAGKVEYEFEPVCIPNFSPKGFKGVDDSPYGGGAGMIMRADVLQRALLEGVIAKGKYESVDDLHIVCPAPRGETWNDKQARAFARDYLSEHSSKDIVFICGRYEGIDERFLEKYVHQYVSLGDYILTGGELAVMVILDSAMRFSSGVLGNKQSAMEESFSHGKLEHALYTRPFEFEGMEVPAALKNGHHKEIEEFKLQSSLEITKKYRPDLLDDC